MKIKILGPISVAAVLLYATAANADQITLGASTAGAFSFTGTGSFGTPPNAITVTVGAGGLSGTGYFGNFQDLGNYTFGPTTFTTNTLSGNNFSIGPGAVEDFSWASFTDADAVTGLIKWTQLKDNSPNPDLIGFLDYTASGDAAFLASFGTHGTAEIDIVFRNLSSGILLDNLALTTNSETAVISSGEVVPTTVPEPASLALFGTGLLAMGWLTRRRRQKA
jgi:PEP-CTERM motif-containing protein